MFKDFDIQIVTGDKLEADIETADALPRRDCFSRLTQYLERPSGKLMLLNGLRRTGKTVLAKQGVRELPQEARKKSVFIKFPYCTQGIPKNQSYELIEDLYDEGYRYFFLDECTGIREFPSWAKDIADGPAARGCHVVLLGTDSLSIWLAKRNALEGRYVEIRTTRIPFHEWRRLLEHYDRSLTVDDYINYGGILDFDGVPIETALIPEITNSFRDPSSVEQYVYAAIAMNIQNSVARNAAGPEFSSLYPLWKDGILIEAVQRIVQDQNNRIVIQKCIKLFENDDFFDTYKNIDPESRKYINEKKKEIIFEIEMRLGLFHRGIQLSKDTCITVENYLRRVDVLTDSEVRILPSLNPEKRRTEKLYRNGSRVLLTQPGIRTGQMQLACSLVWNVLEINRSPIQKGDFVRTATSMIRGQMLEDIVFADLFDALPPGCHMFKLEWDAGVLERAEFDVAIIDERDIYDPRVSLIEVKYSDGIDGSVAKYLKNPMAIAQISEAFGRVVSRAVVYNGATKRNAVLFVNANEFLAMIGQNIEHALFPQLADRWKPECPLESWMEKYQQDVENSEDSPSVDCQKLYW